MSLLLIYHCYNGSGMVGCDWNKHTLNNQYQDLDKPEYCEHCACIRTSGPFSFICRLRTREVSKKQFWGIDFIKNVWISYHFPLNQNFWSSAVKYGGEVETCVYFPVPVGCHCNPRLRVIIWLENSHHAFGPFFQLSRC